LLSAGFLAPLRVGAQVAVRLNYQAGTTRTRQDHVHCSAAVNAGWPRNGSSLSVTAAEVTTATVKRPFGELGPAFVWRDDLREMAARSTAFGP
jgi:hypothetical protein